MRPALLLASTVVCMACGSQAPAPRPTTPRARVQEAVPSEDCVPLQEVQRALSARNMAFQDCYVDGLSLDPNLSGTVTLRVVIPPSGEAAEIAIASSDLANERVDQCIVEVAGGLAFAQRTCRLPQTVEYPVRLARGSSEFASAH